jgi:hypothetical protein
MLSEPACRYPQFARSATAALATSGLATGHSCWPGEDAYRVSDPIPTWLCLTELQYVDGLGEQPGAPGAAANAV